MLKLNVLIDWLLSAVIRFYSCNRFCLWLLKKDQAQTWRLVLGAKRRNQLILKIMLIRFLSIRSILSDLLCIGVSRFAELFSCQIRMFPIQWNA